MKKIAIYYEGASLGRNDGNPLYVTAFMKRAQFYLNEILKKNLDESLLNYFPNHEVDDELAKNFAKWFLEEFGCGFKIDHLRPHGDLHTYGEYDLHLWIDWGEDGLKGILPYEPIWPKKNVVYWASDTHLGYEYRLDRAKHADVVFCAQEDAIGRFSEEGVKAIWLPHAFEPLAYPKHDLASKKYDVCFVGHVNNDKRVEMLDKAFKAFPNFYYGQKRFEEAAHKFAESKVSINCAMIQDLNMRCFEVMGSGNLLVTDDIPSIHALFEDKKHLVLYKNFDDMIVKIQHCLDNPGDSSMIAEQGYSECMEKHTIGNRVTKIFMESAHLLKEKVYA